MSSRIGIKCATLATLGNSAALDKATIPQIVQKYHAEINTKLIDREKRISRISNKINSLSTAISYIVPIILFFVILGALFLGNIYAAYPEIGVFIAVLYMLYAFFDLFFNWNIPSLKTSVKETIAALLNKSLGNIDAETD